MERIDIESSTYYNFVDRLSIRPSVKKRIRQALRRESFYDTIDLCKKSENDLRAVEGIDDDLVDKIKAQMLNAGLHFNMTDEQLDDYLDAEFLSTKHYDPNVSFKKSLWDKYGVKLLFFVIVVIPSCGLAYYCNRLFKEISRKDKPDPPKIEYRSKSNEDLTPTTPAMREDTVSEVETEEECNEDGIPYSELEMRKVESVLKDSQRP